MKILIFYLIIMNILSFSVYAADKKKAQRHKWRVPEAQLIMLAVVGGSIGALLAMYLLRHKTKHAKFTIGVPLILAAQILLIGLIIFKLSH